MGTKEEKDPEEIAKYYEPLYREAWRKEAYPRYEQAFLEFFDKHPQMPHDEKVRIVSSRSH